MNRNIKAILLIAGVIALTFFTAMQTHSEPEPAETTAAEILTVAEVAPEVQEAEEASEEFATLEEFQASPGYVKFMIDNLWILIAAFMVLIMHLGFATVESGMTQSKNSVNVIYKNVFILCAGLLLYALVGFQIMYPVGMLTTGYGMDMTIWSDFIFQGMFAATAATIVSGCVTGRIKLSSFMIFGVLLVGISYPITGSWVWGGGWLSELGFHDFAGSSLVHGVGGAAGLACVMLLGSRTGKYKDGKVSAIPAHNIPLATVGVFLLWFGWFGFNGGSVLSADPAGVSYVFVTTALAACAGALASMLTTQIVMHNLDAPMALNGILAGLVGVTAGADVVSVMGAVTIGAVAGVIVVFAIIMFDKLRLDDPVGAISVHGVCGIWGTVAVGLFSSQASVGVQLMGTLAITGTTFLFSLAVFGAIKALVGVRVSPEVESDGLDISEHGNKAYPDFSPVRTSELGAFTTSS